MSKPLKYTAWALCAVLVVGLITGVAYWSLNRDGGDAAEPVGLIVDGTLIEDPGTIVTVGTHEVDYALYRYQYLTSVSTYLNSDSGYFAHDVDGTRGDTVKTDTEDNLRMWFAWIDLAAAEGITLTQEEIDGVDADIETDRATYGDKLEANLAGNHVQDMDTYRRIMLDQTLINKVRDALYDEIVAEVEDTVLDGAVSAKHILIMPSNAALDEYADGTLDVLAGLDYSDGAEDGDGDEATEDETAGNTPEDEADAEANTPEERDYDALAKEFADYLHSLIINSADPEATFEQLRALYDDDAGSQGEDGYTFVEGDMVTEFYEGALALSVGAISAPVETTYGYHILMRLPLNEEYIETNLDTMVSSAAYTLYAERYSEVYEALEIKPGEYYGYITPDTVK